MNILSFLPAIAAPLALLGLIGIPTLCAIYWLRSRPRKMEVASLLL